MKLSIAATSALKHFVGKICTVMVPASAGKFDVTNNTFVNFFVGRVDEIDSEYVLMSHLITGRKSAFLDIISIHEEQVVDPSSPDYEKVKKDYSDKMKTVSPQKSTGLLSVESLTQQANEIKQKMVVSNERQKSN